MATPAEQGPHLVGKSSKLLFLISDKKRALLQAVLFLFKARVRRFIDNPLLEVLIVF